MEDRYSFHEDYSIEDDSDEDQQIRSSDEEGDLEKYFLATENGKEVLKQLKSVSNDASEEIDNELIELGEAVPKENLLYGEEIDRENEEWMAKKRNLHKTTTSGSKPPKSDAMLSCPACMVTVCVDCQRHELYKTQFRAMFVMNCVIVRDQLLRYEHKNKSKKRRKKEGPGKLVEYKPTLDITTYSEQTNNSLPSTSQSNTTKNSIETYRPVQCSVCSTEIGVFDNDEIFHFFNVIESLA